ncbi:WXG100 family type VII secretion target [Nonomuraea solani]|uniref:WXG100 family type VII secretion target n=1 Tax=Nonomuraea solani TaxID=1144553 RepID=A0A1H6ERJ3_9ACTN|nr:transglycosylase SLT domain-containing protein [Nonomuraea solani]SEG99449.1 WXG100 family type VII secretion target [Nonomuraea solani]
MSVSHLPGGAELDAMLRKVTGKPGTIESIAKEWVSLSGDMDDFAGALSGAVQNVANAWQGRSADQFDTYMRKYGTAAGDLKSALTKSAASLNNAAGALRTSHSEISAILRDLNTNAATYKKQFFNKNPDAPNDGADEGLKKLVAQAKTDAQPWVNSADAAVTKAKGEINRYLGSERGVTFRSIPDVTTQEFVPENGRKIDWKPEPGYQQQGGGKGGGTNLQGNTGGSGGFGGYGPSGPPPAGGGPAPTGQVKDWIEQAIAILTKNGVPASKMNASDIWMIIKHESGGNPNAINNWDSNAAKGTPSKGLMQTIDPTFNAHKLAGHGDIYNPVDNIIAGVRYAIERYGSVSNVPGVVNSKQGLGYVGY